jgi:hypothetical protein
MSEAVLKGLLPKLYYEHWMLFVKAYRTLVKDKITSHEIDFVEACLQAFYKGVEELYSPIYATIKVHQLIHVANAVREYGPLRNISSYPFEDLNGKLIDQNHATNNPIEHLHLRISRLNFIRSILHSMRDANGNEFTNDHPYIAWLEKVIDWRYIDEEELPRGWEVMRGLSNEYICRFSTSDIWKSNDQILQALHKYGLNVGNLRTFDNFRIKNIKFHTEDASIYYNDSRWVQFRNEQDKLQVGRLLLGVTDGNHYYVAVNAIERPFVTYKLLVSEHDQQYLEIINISQIVDQCVHIDHVNGNFMLLPLSSNSLIIPYLSCEQLPEQYEEIHDDTSVSGIITLVENPENRHEWNKV